MSDGCNSGNHENYNLEPVKCGIKQKKLNYKYYTTCGYAEWPT